VTWRLPFSIVFAIALLLGACGEDELSLTEYVDQINVAAREASARGAELIEGTQHIADFTPQDVTSTHGTALREVRRPLQEAADAIEPPDQVEDLHDLLWDWHARFIDIEEKMAAAAADIEDSAAGWTAFSNSPEMAAYRAALAEGKTVCNDFQAQLDATADRGVFADTPWLPGELKEMVVAALGCESFPDNPEHVYLYPPP
jgi:hypothetical protein